MGRSFPFYIEGSLRMNSRTERQEGAQVAYVFPGQGSQSVGMGLELYRSSQAAQQLLDEVDEILGIPLTRYMFEGPSEELAKTINSQPAIMATSLGCVKALNEFAGQDVYHPAALAGHSLGEYTSMVVSGALDLADGMRLVRERGRLMQKASDIHPGTMAAILGLDEDTMEEICLETGAEMANVNGSDQIVISGDRMCVARAVDMASIRGARKSIPLAVSGAFHSSLMSPAQEGLAAAIEEAGFRDPLIPVIANSTSTALTTAQAAKDELLAQLCTCVQWKSSVMTMMDAGVSTFIEFGPGRVLGGLIKRIGAMPAYSDRHVDVLNVADPSSLGKVVEAVGRDLPRGAVPAF